MLLPNPKSRKKLTMKNIGAGAKNLARAQLTPIGLSQVEKSLRHQNEKRRSRCLEKALEGNRRANY